MTQSEKESGLGRYISQRRKQMGLTQEKLAGKLGVSKSAIAKWETDGGLPDRDNLRKLSEILNVPVDDLHTVIEGESREDSIQNVNITPEIIAILENYGYKVIHPEAKKEREEKQ